MTNKPKSPAPDQIKYAREQAGLSQTDAANLVHAGLRTWQQWERNDRAMPLAAWELFLIKTGQPEFFQESQKNLVQYAH